PVEKKHAPCHGLKASKSLSLAACHRVQTTRAGGLFRRLEAASDLRQGLEEERAEAVAGEIAERGQFERVVAAGQHQGLVLDAVCAQCFQNLLRELGPERWVITPADHQAAFSAVLDALDVGEGADRRPEA